MYCSMHPFSVTVSRREDAGCCTSRLQRRGHYLEGLVTGVTGKHNTLRYFTHSAAGLDLDMEMDDREQLIVISQVSYWGSEVPACCESEPHARAHDHTYTYVYVHAGFTHARILLIKVLRARSLATPSQHETTIVSARDI